MIMSLICLDSLYHGESQGGKSKLPERNDSINLRQRALLASQWEVMGVHGKSVGDHGRSVRGHWIGIGDFCGIFGRSISRGYVGIPGKFTGNTFLPILFLSIGNSSSFKRKDKLDCSDRDQNELQMNSSPLNKASQNWVNQGSWFRGAWLWNVNLNNSNTLSRFPSWGLENTAMRILTRIVILVLSFFQLRKFQDVQCILIGEWLTYRSIKYDGSLWSSTVVHHIFFHANNKPILLLQRALAFDITERSEELGRGVRVWYLTGKWCCLPPLHSRPPFHLWINLLISPSTLLRNILLKWLFWYPKQKSKITPYYLSKRRKYYMETQF